MLFIAHFNFSAFPSNFCCCCCCSRGSLNRLLCWRFLFVAVACQFALRLHLICASDSTKSIVKMTKVQERMLESNCVCVCVSWLFIIFLLLLLLVLVFSFGRDSLVFLGLDFRDSMHIGRNGKKRKKKSKKPTTTTTNGKVHEKKCRKNTLAIRCTDKEYKHTHSHSKLMGFMCI